jgi:hypothetical protein
METKITLMVSLLTNDDLRHRIGEANFRPILRSNERSFPRGGRGTLVAMPAASRVVEDVGFIRESETKRVLVRSCLPGSQLPALADGVLWLPAEQP